MRILFIGTVQFSLEMLSALIDSKADIVGVITDDDKGLNSDYADLIPLCEHNHILVYKTGDVNSPKALEWAQRQCADIIFCLGWSRLIKKELLRLTPMGVVGYHPAELPKNRGRHPLIWAIVLGLQNTASSFFFMTEGVDNGDILSQERIEIGDHDDAGSLYKKIIAAAKVQVIKIVDQLERGTLIAIKQDHSKANFWRKRGKNDGRIDWRMSSKTIHNLVRGLTRPYVGAHFEYQENVYTVWQSKLIDCNDFGNIESGKIVSLSLDENIIVKCGTGCIELSETEPIIRLEIGDYL